MSTLICSICQESPLKGDKIIHCPNITCSVTACSNCWYNWHTRDYNQTIEPLCMNLKVCNTYWSPSYIFTQFNKKRAASYTRYRKETFYKLTKVMVPKYRHRLEIEKWSEELRLQQKELTATGNAFYKKYGLVRETYELIECWCSYDCDCDKVYGGDPEYRLIDNSYYQVIESPSFNFGTDEPIYFKIKDIEFLETTVKFNYLNHIIKILETYIYDIEMPYSVVETKIKTEQADRDAYLNGEKVDNDSLGVTFISHCPRKECVGFITSTYKCVKCEAELCKYCQKDLSIDGSMHECAKDDILSLSVINGTSKACPVCKVNIFKIEGCNDMFCIHCQTSFNWSTLEVYKDSIPHNPHLAEMNQRLNRGMNDQSMCLDLFNTSILLKALSVQKNAVIPDLEVLLCIIREIPGCARDYFRLRGTDHNIRLNLERRLYSNQINEKKMIDLMWSNELKNNYYDEVFMIRVAWAESASYLISQVLNEKKNLHIFDDFKDRIRSISIIARKSLAELANNYGIDISNKMVFPIFESKDRRFISIYGVSKSSKDVLKQTLDTYLITDHEINCPFELTFLKKLHNKT